jgi:prolycopene isomerase
VQPPGEVDVVVIGAGLGGLSAAAFLAKAGKRVLVVDAAPRAGGLLAELPMPGYHMSPGIHTLTGCFEDGPAGEGILSAVGRHLGLEGVELVPVEVPFRLSYPGLDLALPTGREGWIEAHAEHFPRERAGLTDLMDLCERVMQELYRLPIAPDVRWLARMPRQAPTLLRYRSATVLDVLDAKLEDPRLKRVVSGFCESYYGLPPARTSFLLWAWGTASYATGTHVCRGGYQRLADAFVTAIQARQGRVWLGTPVSRIVTHEGRVHAIGGDGWQVVAPVVVAATDPRQLPRLLGQGVLPERYLRRLERSMPSDSAVAVYVATTLDLTAQAMACETLVIDSYDFMLSSDEMLCIHVPTLADPTMAPEGQHLVELERLAGHGMEDPFAQAGELVQAGNRSLPGLADSLVPVGSDAATPYQMRRFSPMYGWAALPQQFGLGRLPHRVPVSGLFLAGHWTRPAYAIPGVVWSGAEVARIIDHDRVTEPLLPLM